MPVLERKLQIPQAERAPVLPETGWQLLQQPATLVLVHAPAGFGKTTLLAHWARQQLLDQNRPLAWLSLDRRDTRPRRFARGLVAALRGLGPGTDAQWQNLLETTESDDPDLLLEAIEGQAEALTGPAVLIVDDLHLLADSPALEVLSLWLEELPADLTLVLGARHLPAGLPLARWRLQGKVLEIPPEALRWGEAELQAFFADLALSPGQLIRIGQKSQGWALACQLLRLQLTQGVELETAIEQLGRHSLLEDYLQQEVLPFLPPEALEFLVQTSVLADLTPEACAALVPAGPALEGLARRLPFLTPLDRARQWYVCHPLLRDWLQQQLLPDQRSRLHAAAARHFLAVAAHEPALEHAQLSGQPEVLAEVLEALAQTLLGLGRIHTLQQAFEALPEAILRQRPALAMFQIWIWLLVGE
ncbi:MAG: AAA family ATPase, partial [Candidatus Sericytochromatia bacterium]